MAFMRDFTGNIFGAKALNLSHLPPIYVIPSRTPAGFSQDFGNSLRKCFAEVVDDPQAANIFVGMINTKKRAQFELRALGVWTEEFQDSASGARSKTLKRSGESFQENPRKLQRLDTSETEDGSVTEDEATNTVKACAPWDRKGGQSTADVFVLKLQWLEDSLAQNQLLDPQDFLVLAGRNKMKLEDADKSFDLDRVDSALAESMIPASQSVNQAVVADILERAKADAPFVAGGSSSQFASAPYGRRRFRDQGTASKLGVPTERPRLIDLQTSSQEGAADYELPAIPDWVREGRNFSCQRATLADSPNEEFIQLLLNIRLSRLLFSDEVGVKSYSTAIAAIASLRTKIVNPKEVLRLPGCDTAIANYWIEYRNTGEIQAAKEIYEKEKLRTLKDFYDIWGVGETTAMEFYEDKGWRDRDDILEYGWQSLSRVQQIGLKYYDDFLVGIPRPEVEFILEKVKEHAIKVRDSGIEAIIVGGYRRGKAESGDVDVVVSHRDFDKTANLVHDIVASLEEEGYITHTLSLHLTATKRGQNTLPFKSAEKVVGSGFDTLDKALVVWQDINWPTKEQDLKKNPKAKNPNIHRRVDIIISPWRTVGCAVLGWSGGNTFQRDLRKYSKVAKGWKFDSSGIRDTRNGQVVELEGPNGVDGSMVDAEKVVFAGLGLDYREPYERWTR